jgi:hypothetical protein
VPPGRAISISIKRPAALIGPPLAYVFDAESFSMTANADVISGVENARVRSVHDIGTRLSRNAAQFLNLRALTALWN